MLYPNPDHEWVKHLVACATSLGIFVIESGTVVGQQTVFGIVTVIGNFCFDVREVSGMEPRAFKELVKVRWMALQMLFAEKRED